MELPDPLDIALREVTECKETLERLVTSSETFDYHAAKAALVALDRKIRDLGKTKARLEHARRRRQPVLRVLDFAAAASRSPARV